MVGLLRDKTRKPGTPPLSRAAVDRVVELTLADPPHEATHWTGRMMAKAVGVSLRSVQRIWKAHRLAPHRVRTFKLSTDPAFVTKLRDVVGLYVHPPAHAIVLSVDEKSQIQALGRTQSGLPPKEGRPATATHDYGRHGTTTLFAAFNVLDGTVLGRCMQRHRHQVDLTPGSGGFANEPGHPRRTGWRRSGPDGGSRLSSRPKRSSGCWRAAGGCRRSRPSWG